MKRDKRENVVVSAPWVREDDLGEATTIAPIPARRMFVRLVCLLAIVLAGAFVSGCAQQSSGSSSSSKTSSSSDSATRSMYAGYSIDSQPFNLMIFPAENSIGYIYQDHHVEAASILLVFYDAYGDRIGVYDLSLDKGNIFNATMRINGISSTAKARAYLYSHVLDDGTTWGNRYPASESEITKYGRELSVEVIGV